MTETKRKGKKVVLYFFLALGFILIGLFSYSVIGYLFFENSGGAFCMAFTKGCFLGTPICINFPDCRLPALWFKTR